MVLIPRWWFCVLPPTLNCLGVFFSRAMVDGVVHVVVWLGQKVVLTKGQNVDCLHVICRRRLVIEKELFTRSLPPEISMLCKRIEFRLACTFRLMPFRSHIQKKFKPPRRPYTREVQLYTVSQIYKAENFRDEKMSDARGDGIRGRESRTGARSYRARDVDGKNERCPASVRFQRRVKMIWIVMVRLAFRSIFSGCSLYSKSTGPSNPEVNGKNATKRGHSGDVDGERW